MEKENKIKEYNKPGSGNIWKNKYLINYPNKIFTIENSSTYKKVINFFI